MGYPGPFSKSCYTNGDIYTAPNPDPTRYVIEHTQKYTNATLLRVRYLDCTNFEGVKLLVFKGDFTPESGAGLDPHFSDKRRSPVARFIPSSEGLLMAETFCLLL